MMSARSSFRYAAGALMLGALAHIAGHRMGPETIGFMGAPPDVVQGARDGTALYYAMITAIIGLLFGLAWLAYKTHRQRLPRICLWVFAVIFMLRGLLFVAFIPAALSGNYGPDPAKFWFHFCASIFVLTIGMSLTNGLWKTRAPKLSK